MATGYTSRLKELDYNTRKWLLEVVPRAMGVCIMLRDEPMDFPFEKMRAAISNSESNYHPDALARAQSKKEEMSGWGMDEWEAKMLAENAARFKDNNERSVEHEQGLASMTRVADEIKTLQTKSQGEPDIVVNGLKFALKQVEETISWDFGNEIYQAALFEDWDKMKLFHVEQVDHDIDYHSRKLDEEDARVKERLAAFDVYVAFVQKYLIA